MASTEIRPASPAPEPSAGALRLGPDQVFHACDPATLPFRSVTELEDLSIPPGQEVAIEALQFGLSIGHPDYHLYAFAPVMETRLGFVRDFLEREAANRPAPGDLCYVNNFENPQRPHAITLPSGRGAQFRDAMKQLVQELRAVLPAAFESEDYRARRQVVDETFKQRHEQAFEALHERAQKERVALIRTPMGIAFAPMRGNEVVQPEEFQRLPEAERKKITQTIESLQAELETIIRQVPIWAREHRDQVRTLNHDVTRHAVAHLMEELRDSFKDIPAVMVYLTAIERDVLENADDFLSPEGGHGDGQSGPLREMAFGDQFAFRRYWVNLLVDSSGHKGAPVVYEDNPTVHSLVGRIEHIARFGALLTDFNLLKPGALHRANGGFLLLDAFKLLRNGLSYDALKRALRAGEIRIQSLEQMLSLTGTVSPEAEPVPLSVKIVLIGPRWLYYLLCEADSEFAELFKVQVDVEDRVDRDAGNTLLLARSMAATIRRLRLRPFDATAVARLVEFAARASGDGMKLSIETPLLVDMLKESDYWSGQAGRALVAAEDVQRTIDTRQRRADRLYRRLREQVRNGVLNIETDGRRVGQVNGLSVISLGGFSFGHPSRITAQARLGSGRVLDIEREVELGGRLHSKGVLILCGFLGGRYTRDKTLSLQASLVFEQSYGPIEGDSASSAELYALLSAIGQIPLRQDLAVTGSVDQRGQIQAIGGVNEKIEGFYDTCAELGLTGRQGVIVPAANLRHLMLRKDVVAAVAAGKFSVYAVKTADEGVALLSGMPAGEAGPDGAYPAGSVNHAIAERLDAFARKAIELGRAAGGGSDADKK